MLEEIQNKIIKQDLSWGLVFLNTGTAWYRVWTTTEEAQVLQDPTSTGFRLIKREGNIWRRKGKHRGETLDSAGLQNIIFLFRSSFLFTWFRVYWVFTVLEKNYDWTQVIIIVYRPLYFRTNLIYYIHGWETASLTCLTLLSPYDDLLSSTLFSWKRVDNQQKNIKTLNSCIQ